MDKFKTTHTPTNEVVYANSIKELSRKLKAVPQGKR
jgi:hypothetical protein